MRRSRRRLPLGMVMALMLAMAIVPVSVQAQGKTSITTPEIITAGTNFSCMEWRVSGICFWLDCDITGCRIETSVRISHFNPSLVVTSYNTLGDSPWTEIAALYGGAQVVANEAHYAVMGVTSAVGPGGGKSVEPVARQNARINKVYKDAEVIGGPGNAATLAAEFGLPLFCPMTDIAPLAPYFLSGLDTFAWRSALTEAIYAASWVPGLEEIGTWPLNTWGSVYPRNGFLASSEEPKAAAVMASRAADIAVKTGQPHVYIPVGSIPGWPGGRMKVWPPSGIDHGSSGSIKWQMLLPKTESSCAIFGENDTFNVFDGWTAGRTAPHADYAWNLWRPYTCCEIKGIFLFAVGF